MKTVFLSSTSKDLELYRKAAIDVCMRLSLHPIAMEYFNAQSAGATAGSKRQLDKADLYVGFFAHRYGYIEDGYTTSVTEIEFDYAAERGLDRICFIIDPKHPWPEDTMDHENNAKLVAFKNKVNKLIRSQFTSVDNFAMQLTTSLVEWNGGLQGRASGGSSAVHATHPDDLAEKPDKLFGRDQLLSEVRALLENHDRVLLQGFGGMGKTALAATIAARWITDGKGAVLWLKAGSSETDALFEALARPFNAQQAVASQTGDAKIKALRDLLRGCGASLLVLDDCWNNKALFDLIKAVPSDMALLVTARQRYPLSKIKLVDELAPSDALSLLAYHADQTFTPPTTVGAQGLAPAGNQTVTPSATPSVGTRHAVSVGGEDNNASALCHLLGNHAFAIEIAGKTLKVHNWTPADLIQNIHDAPDQLTMPLELSQTGRENVAKLLEVSLNALDDSARNIFLAFGAFFAPQTTPEMLQLYFDGASSSPLPEGEGLGVRVAEDGLNTLHLHGLAERLPATDTSITAYRIHDLAYSYAKAQAADDQHQRALQTCLSYTVHYKQPSLSNFAALRPELDNLLGAATWAFEHEHYAAVERFAWNLYRGSEFLYYGGFSSEATRLLSLAAQAAEHAGSKRDQAAHLGNLGLAYRALGQVEKAIDYHQQALAVSREIGDKSNEGSQLGNLGIAYRNLGQVEKAIDHHQQALVIAREIGNKLSEGNQLGNLGLAYSDLGQVEKAIDYHQQALAISREIGDKLNEGSQLGNLGIAYHNLGQVEKAIDHHQQALTIDREIGNRMGQADDFNNIGNTYDDLKDYPNALDYYQQAHAIYVEIGAQHRVAMVDRNIALTQAEMNATNTDAPNQSA